MNKGQEEAIIILEKPTAVLAASPRPGRYSYMAVQRLKATGHPVFPLGYRADHIEDEAIITGFPMLENIHTVTLYLNPRRQPDLYGYILSLKPERLIFNPGTENLELQKLAEENGIETVIGCTLVMLASGLY